MSNKVVAAVDADKQVRMCSEQTSEMQTESWRKQVPAHYMQKLAVLLTLSIQSPVPTPILNNFF